VAHIGKKNDAYRDLGKRSEGNSPLGRPRYICDETIKIYLKYNGALHTIFIQLGMDRLL
jgi:hypothetical protein